MTIDMTLFVLPAELGIDAARAMLASVDLDRLRMHDDADALTYAVAQDWNADGGEDAAEEQSVENHAARWIESFALLASGDDPFFENRFARRERLSGGCQLLIIGFDLDGVHDPVYEDAFSLASAH